MCKCCDLAGSSLHTHALYPTRAVPYKISPGPRSLTLEHVPVGIVRDGVDVRRHLRPPLALVHVHHLGCVDGQPPVGVDCHTEEARVSLAREERETVNTDKLLS